MRSHYPVKGIIIAICLLILMAFAQIALAGGEAEPASYAAGDIQFCPKGKPYLHTSCSPVRTSMATAISDAQTAAASGISGTIYLESGSYGGTINFSGFTYGTSLIVQGGVNSGTTTFTRAMYLSGNDLDFTLRDVTFAHAVTGEMGLYTSGNTGDLTIENVNATVGDGSGFYITYQTGDVSMKDVWSGNNHLLGIYLNYIYGDVDLADVIANNNGTVNIYLETIFGSVKFEGITAYGSSTDYGIYIEDVQGKKGVIMSDVSSYGNVETNIHIQTVTNNVSLTDVMANWSSGGTGANGINIDGVSGKKGVTLNRVTANNNSGTNIMTYDIAGNVSLTDITADSGYYGIYCTSIAGSRGVTMKNVSANSNAWDNVIVLSIAGNVNMTNIQANSSINEFGIHIQTVDGSKGVVLKDIIANLNAVTGLRITDIEGNVTASGVQTMNSSGVHGVHIENVRGSKGVILKNIDSHLNDDNGFLVKNITGNVSLSGINANFNGAYGIEADDIDGSKGVSLKTGSANTNELHNVYFHDILGNVDLKDVTTNNSNSQSGIWLEDIYGSKGVTLKTIISKTNDIDGVAIDNVPNGNASLSGVEVESSGSFGIDINTINGPKGVTLKGIVSNSNTGQNLRVINVVGNVALKDVLANLSSAFGGISISYVDGSKGVKLDDVTTLNNDAANIVIMWVSGDVSMKKIETESAGDQGIYIYDVQGSKGVMLKDVSAIGNNLDNISINALDPGDVVLNKVTASDSLSGRGLNVDTVAGEVMVQNSTFNDNDLYGIETADISGLVLLNKIIGNDSDTSSGAYLGSSNNQLVCSSQFINNFAYGIVADTPGYSLTIAGTDLTSTPNGAAAYSWISGTKVWDNVSSKCVVIPPP